MENRRRFNIVAIAGTFDRLHKGHQYFIRQAFSHGDRVLIGLTSDEFTKSKVKSQKSKLKLKLKTQNYRTRKIELVVFLTREKLLGRAEIVKIDNLYGPAIEVNSIEALVVTEDSWNGAIEVNRKRKELKLKSLKLLTIPMIMAQDRKRIASTRIRIGEIDRAGKVFLKLVYNPTDRLKFKPISGDLRRELKKPQGILTQGDINDLNKIVPELKTLIRRLQPLMISTIGDEVTKVCNNAGLTPDLAIFDYKVNRKKIYHSYYDLGIGKSITKPLSRPGLEDGIVAIRNPSGNISRSLVRAVEKAIKGIISDGRQRLIRVIGEDDLSAVPAILLSPLGSVVIYGQPPSVPNSSGLQQGRPSEGVVVVEITEDRKQKMVNLLEI